ncbi:DUF2955 domain-containing protein [Jeongeupia chitinilytica]|uniref:DUF2955 domain-containing protein n=1 Tax=Jeongeupia chitinilytica TaxID=1041641 RepID=A0ABQ3H3X2_9NEIS|nr:DUF2955 domain-containing protein [Jeongeupia chitinilytica]GHD67337.1 hypothetical protein GCM10007350_30870 [Jeongeupia chitinilytica]
MHRGDRAVLRLAAGLGLTVLVAYGMALAQPYVVCLLAVLLLCKPGPPMPLLKAAFAGLFVAALMAAGVLMVPLLEHYPASAAVLTALTLYVLFLGGLRRRNPLLLLPVIAVALIPIAGVTDQASALQLAKSLGAGIALGATINLFSHALIPDTATVVPEAPAAADVTGLTWIAARAVLIVMPMWLLALSNPSLYIAGLMKTVTLGQQACAVSARQAGRELVGSTLLGALLAALLWAGLGLHASLWMLGLWLAAAALWIGRRLYRLVASRYPPSFWSNALMTALILLGPAIEDSATGKDVMQASLTRLALFVAVAGYASLTVLVLERWHARRAGTSGT